MIKDLKEAIKFLEIKYTEYKVRYEKDGKNILKLKKQGWEDIKKKDHPEIYHNIGFFLKKKKLFYRLSPILYGRLIPIVMLVLTVASLYFMVFR